MKKWWVLFVVLLAACSLNQDLIGTWSGMDAGWPVVYTFTADAIEYEEASAPAMRGPMVATETTIAFRYTEFYNAGQWWDITDDMPWYSDTDTVWGWSVEGDTLFLLRGSDTLTLVKS